MAVALLLPVTYGLDPVGSFIMFAGIYYGGMYGGSTTSILLNTPGESASIITAVEGNLMARKGRGAAALATAAIGSFVAGTIATIALTFVAPVMVQLALKFGPADYFALMIWLHDGSSVRIAVLRACDRLRRRVASVSTCDRPARYTWQPATARGSASSGGRRIVRGGGPLLRHDYAGLAQIQRQGAAG